MLAVFELLYQTLKNSGIDVYVSGAHKGLCASPYVVIKAAEATQYRRFTTTIQYYDVICYGRTVSEVLELVEDTKLAMKNLEPTLMDTYTQEEPYFDSDVQAWMLSMSYRNYKKNT